MKLPKISIARIVFGLLGVVVILMTIAYVTKPSLFNFGVSDEVALSVPVASSTYSNAKFGVSFAYAPNLLLSERDLVVNGSGVHLVAINQKKEGQYAAGEGDPGINISIFPNPAHMPLPEWLQSMHNGSTGGFDYKEAIIGGERAIIYTATGLYESDNAAIAKGNFVYVFSGSWITRSDALLKVFSSLLSTVHFK